MARFANALQLALGSVGAGIGGYQKAQAQREEEERLRRAEARQAELDRMAQDQQLFSRATALQGLGFRPRTVDDGGELDSSLASPMALPTTSLPLSSALTKAGQSAQSPAMQMRLPGVGTIAFDRPETEDEKLNREIKKHEEQQRVIQQRDDLKREQSDRGIFNLLQREGQFPATVSYEDVKGIGSLEPYLKDFLAGKSQASALNRALIMARAQSNMGTYVQGVGEEGQPTQLFFGTRGGQLTPTGVQAPKNVNATRIPVTDKKGMNELEATVLELERAIKAVDDNPDAFGFKTMLPNVVLSRGTGVTPRATVTGAITKLRRTDFGTAQTESEKKSGVAIYPADGEAAPSVKEKLGALRDKALLELNTKRGFYGMEPFAPPSASPAQQSVAPAGGRPKTLEDEFPNLREQIQEARRNRYSDAQIRAKIMGGR